MLLMLLLFFILKFWHSMFSGGTFALLFYKCLQLCRYLCPGHKLDPVSGECFALPSAHGKCKNYVWFCMFVTDCHASGAHWEFWISQTQLSWCLRYHIRYACGSLFGMISNHLSAQEISGLAGFCVWSMSGKWRSRYNTHKHNFKTWLCRRQCKAAHVQCLEVAYVHI